MKYSTVTEVRTGAVRILSRLDASASEDLLKLLDNKSPKVRREAIIGLGRRKEQIAIPRLVRILKKFCNRDEWLVAAVALTHIAEEGAMPVLKQTAWRQMSLLVWANYKILEKYINGDEKYGKLLIRFILFNEKMPTAQELVKGENQII